MSESESGLTSKDDLRVLASVQHYGWQWSGPEPARFCTCARALCGLVSKVHPDCLVHEVQMLGRSKQRHSGLECPVGQGSTP